jgi:APA family basic amino acid/polyamine antiporter
MDGSWWPDGCQRRSHRRLFPRIFAKTSARGIPVAALVIGSALATALIAMNYTRGLVDLFTFIILLATLSTLVPYSFCSVAGLLNRDFRRRPSPSVVHVLAFAYSLWAIAGAGADVVYWGFLLLIAGLPVYVTVKR